MNPALPTQTLLQLPAPDASGADCIAAYVRQLPDAPGVYRMLNQESEVLYVGKARSLKKRVSHYTQLERQPTRLQRMIVATRRMEFITTRTEAEALLLEANLIKEFQPRYNILLKDDKSYPYIRIDHSHPYPRVEKYRSRKPKQAKGLYGPYPSALAVNATITTLQKAFLLRPCADTVFANRSRPCLQYQIKRCSAPCVGYVSSTDYAALMAQAEAFLQGKSNQVKQDLVQQMEQASERMDYERAAELRDRIKALSAVQSTQRQQFTQLRDADIIALYQEGAACCIQLFSFRQGVNVGNRSFFPAQTEDAPAARILHQFIGQYYPSQRVPRQVLCNLLPEEPELLAAALKLKEGHGVVLAVPQRGEKKEAIHFAERNAREALQRQQAEHMSHAKTLQQVAALFHLPAPPQRIEVYDNSHLMGKHALGAMIVATPEGFQPNAYRIFNMDKNALTRGGEHAEAGDDFAMMRAMLRRRLKHLSTVAPSANATPPASKTDPAAITPDLILIDGGQGQLTAALEVLQELQCTHIPVVAIAKGVERNAGREQFFLPGQAPFQLPHHDATLHYLQRLRDEAHRFAIGTHRKKRGKAMIQSALDDVPGIGPTRKKRLLHAFGSARGVMDATLQDLKAVPGINHATAEAIYAYFHPDA